LLLLAGCGGDAGRKYQVGGPALTYCPPADIDITPPRFGQGTLEQGGFAFKGCWGHQGACDPRLKDIVSVSVSTATGEADAYRRGHIGELAANGPREWSDDQSRFLVRDGTGRRFVFDGQRPGEPAGEWTFVASCDQQICDRRVRAGVLEMQYSFHARDTFGGDVAALDAMLLDRVRSWRCESTVQGNSSLGVLPATQDGSPRDHPRSPHWNARLAPHRGAA